MSDRPKVVWEKKRGQASLSTTLKPDSIFVHFCSVRLRSVNKQHTRSAYFRVFLVRFFLTVSGLVTSS